MKEMGSLSLALIVLFTLLISGTLLSLFVEIAFCPGTPIVRLNALSVSDFSVSDLTLSARWDVNFTLYNPNLASVFLLDEIEGFVLYSEDSALSVTAADGFRLGSREEKSLRLKFGTTGQEGDQPLVGYPVLKEIKEEQRRGTVRFSARMSSWASYRTGLFGWTRQVVLSSYCSNLNVGLIENGGGGGLVSDGPLDCSVLVIRGEHFQTKATIGVQISTNGSAEEAVPIWVVQEMEKERRTSGSVTFSLRFAIWSTFKSGTWWMRHMTMRVFCGDLKVDFAAGSGTGNLAAAKRDSCLIYV